MVSREKIVQEILKQFPNFGPNEHGPLNAKRLWLWKGEGYWYFMYDKDGKFETRSVYTMYLKDMSLDNWVADGVDFVKQMEAM